MLENVYRSSAHRLWTFYWYITCMGMKKIVTCRLKKVHSIQAMLADNFWKNSGHFWNWTNFWQFYQSMHTSLQIICNYFFLKNFLCFGWNCKLGSTENWLATKNQLFLHLVTWCKMYGAILVVYSAWCNMNGVICMVQWAWSNMHDAQNLMEFATTGI